MKIDVVIIGGGPSGLTAGLFTARAGLRTIIFEKLALGGQASLTPEIANFPGFSSISGFDLVEKMKEQCLSHGAQILYERIVKVSKTKSGFKIKSSEHEYQTDSIIIAAGCKTRKLGLEREELLTGRGVSYCASCDGNFFRNKVVAVVGGGNTAMEDAEYLSRLANKIYIINRSERFRADKAAYARVKKLNNIDWLTSANVTALNGEEKLDSITVTQRHPAPDGSETKTDLELKVDGLFVAIGQYPELDFIDLDLQRDDAGYIKVDKDMRTSVPRVYACGDIISKSFRQVINACAEGATAANSCIGGV